MSILKSRILLVSDMHYTTEETKEELKKIYPDAIASEAAGKAFGYTQTEKVEKIYEDICEERSRLGLDAVLILGDMSLDDYGMRNLPFNYCVKFKEDCLDRLPCPYYVIPGNHDSYPNDMWKDIFGCDREYVLEFADSIFIMGDVFKGTTVNGPSAPLDTIDSNMLREALEKYAGKRIFICAHHVRDEIFSEDCRYLVQNNSDVVCMFRGHVHQNKVLNFCGKTVFDIGGYCFNGQMINHKYEVNIYDPKWAWGYQILEIYDDMIKTYHVKPKMRYYATNGIFDIEETIEDVYEFTV